MNSISNKHFIHFKKKQNKFKEEKQLNMFKHNIHFLKLR
jgi:hypothetical protein